MAFPLKADFTTGNRLSELDAEWLNTVAHIFNGIRGVYKTPSGHGWRVDGADATVGGGGEDVLVAIDSEATAGFIGNSASTGVINSNAV